MVHLNHQLKEFATDWIEISQKEGTFKTSKSDSTAQKETEKADTKLDNIIKNNEPDKALEEYGKLFTMNQERPNEELTKRINKLDGFMRKNYVEGRTNENVIQGKTKENENVIRLPEVKISDNTPTFEIATQEQINSTINDSRIKYKDKVNNLAQKADELTNELARLENSNAPEEEKETVKDRMKQVYNYLVRTKKTKGPIKGSTTDIFSPNFNWKDFIQKNIKVKVHPFEMNPEIKRIMDENIDIKIHPFVPGPLLGGK